MELRKGFIGWFLGFWYVSSRVAGRSFSRIQNTGEEQIWGGEKCQSVRGNIQTCRSAESPGLASPLKRHQQETILWNFGSGGGHPGGMQKEKWVGSRALGAAADWPPWKLQEELNAHFFYGLLFSFPLPTLTLLLLYFLPGKEPNFWQLSKRLCNSNLLLVLLFSLSQLLIWYRKTFYDVPPATSCKPFGNTLLFKNLAQGAPGWHSQLCIWLGFGSGHDLRIQRWSPEPWGGLCAQRGVCLKILSLCPFLPQINKQIFKKFKKLRIKT